MRMNEDYVSHSLAVALKAAGFDWHCRAAWHYDGSEWNFIKDYASTFQHPKEIPDWNSASWNTPYIVSAPTLAMAQKWLREVKGVIVFVEYTLDKPYDGYSFVVVAHGKAHIYCEEWDTYESALAAGIETALELIIPDNNEKEG